MKDFSIVILLQMEITSVIQADSKEEDEKKAKALLPSTGTIQFCNIDAIEVPEKQPEPEFPVNPKLPKPATK
jgi:hypothetical protein